MNVNEVFNNMMATNKGHIELDIDGYACSGKINGDAGAIILGIKSLITELAKQTNKSEEQILEVVINFVNCSRVLEAESKEQLDVIVELINKM